MTWMLVRKEPSAAMVAAGENCEWIDGYDRNASHAAGRYVEATNGMRFAFGDSCASGAAIAVFAAMTEASGAPTDAELDELCRMMWGHRWYWDNEYDADPEHRESHRLRQNDRTMMRVFTATLNGAKP